MTYEEYREKYSEFLPEQRRVIHINPHGKCEMKLLKKDALIASLVAVIGLLVLVICLQASTVRDYEKRLAEEMTLTEELITQSCTHIDGAEAYR